MGKNPPDVPTTPIDLTYIGRMFHDGKIIHLWQDADSELRSYKKFRTNYCVGTTFTIQEAENGSLIGQPSNYRKIHDAEQIAQWEARDRDAWNRHQEILLIRQLGKDNNFASVVAPLKRIYKKLPPPARQSFLLMLQAELERF